jgi:hypothetical protein
LVIRIAASVVSRKVLSVRGEPVVAPFVVSLSNHELFAEHGLRQSQAERINEGYLRNATLAASCFPSCYLAFLFTVASISHSNAGTGGVLRH